MRQWMALYCWGIMRMEMTKDEIVKKYREKPSFTRIQLIADLNGCTTKEIREVLRSTGEEIDANDKPKSKKVPSTNKTKKDKTEKESIKDIPLEDKMHTSIVYDIPQVVVEMCQEKINFINRQIDAYVEAINQLNDDRNELIDFIAKGEKRDESNELHRKV